MAHVYFNSRLAPCGFLIVPLDAKHHQLRDSVLIQSDWDYPAVASRMGWQPCNCGATDGTVDCEECDRSTSQMIAEAYDYICDRADVNYDALEEYLLALAELDWPQNV